MVGISRIEEGYELENVDLKTEIKKNKQLLLTKETYNVTKRAELRSHDLFS